MSSRSDTVQSLTLIVGSAFAAAFVTSVAMAAAPKPVEPPPAPAEATAVATSPVMFYSYVIGTNGRGESSRSGLLPIRYRVTPAQLPIMFSNGVRTHEMVIPAGLTFLGGHAKPTAAGVDIKSENGKHGNDG